MSMTTVGVAVVVCKVSKADTEMFRNLNRSVVKNLIVTYNSVNRYYQIMKRHFSQSDLENDNYVVAWAMD